jgi:succinylglutamate desuccinylase
MSVSIIKELKGKLPGKTIAVFSGIHGNEKVGVLVVKKMMKTLKIERGTVYLVIANQDAIKKNLRFVSRNLNRCFYKENKGKASEDVIARELMKLLEKCDALLDIHAYHDPIGTPFIICSKKNLELAKIFNTKNISYDWKNLERGATDGFMESENKPGICLECGVIREYKNNLAFAEKSILSFLRYFELIPGKLKVSQDRRIYSRPQRIIISNGEKYSFSKKFKSFEKLTEGKVFLEQGKKQFKAKKNEIIIFPRLNKKKGEEICILGKIVR